MTRETRWSSTFPSILPVERESTAIAHLSDYFGGNYSGAFFERVGGDKISVQDADKVTSDDLVALATLSVPVGGFAAWDLLTGPLAQRIEELLAEIPVGTTIEDAAGVALLREPDGAATRLWSAIRTAGSSAPTRMRRAQTFGQVRTSKLLARKRPHLFPIYDSVVAGQFGAMSSAGHWTAFCDMFENPSFVEHLRRLHVRARLDGRISLLRVLDVAVWMDGR